MSEQNNNEELELDVNHLMAVRKEKLDELASKGKNPFEVTKYNRTHHSKQIKDNYEEYTLYTDLQRGCFGDLTNGEEVTGYLPESGAYLAEDAINAALNTAQSIVSDLDSKLVSDDLN